jgi:pimeloyl-ACP methyl ester carboxylesterase
VVDWAAANGDAALETRGPVVGEVRSRDGLAVRYDVVGRGAPALVFVHGWSCDRSYWRYQTAYFAERSTVVAVDLAGHGESGTGRVAWTMGSFGDDVVAVIDALDLREVVLVGHSMGGDVVVEAARRRPDRVLGLVWVDTYRELSASTEGDAAEEELESFVARFRADFAGATRDFVRGVFGPHADRDLVEWVAADMAAAPTEIALDALGRAVTNERAALAALREAGVPLVAINPESRPTDQASLACHGVSLVLVPEVGHFVMLEDPPGFNRVLEDVVERFLASAGRRPI